MSLATDGCFGWSPQPLSCLFVLVMGWEEAQLCSVPCKSPGRGKDHHESVSGPVAEMSQGSQATQPGSQLLPASKPNICAAPGMFA